MRLRWCGTFLVVLIVLPTVAWSQTTGRLAGTVTDAETGEPLPGAHVIIDGTTQGTVTNVDGEYVIFEVSPGTYTLVSSFTGYQTVRRSEVEVISGITNIQNFELAPSTLELDVVEVTAERTLVNPTATNAVRRMTYEELSALPTRNAATAYAIQPGVTALNNEVYIRGGRPDETEFLLEGITSRSIIGTDNVVPVIPEAVEEVQVFAGGYSAELGGANAGIIQQVLRTGGPRWSGTVLYETDELANTFDNTSYGYGDFTVALGGPLYWRQHRIFGAVSYQETDNYNPVFWYGADFGRPVDIRSAATPDTAAIPVAWEDGVIPGIGRPREQLKVNGTIALDFSPLRVRLGFAQLNQNRRINDTPIYQIFNQERIPKRDDMSRLANLQATYFLSDQTFLEANVGIFKYAFEQYDPLFDKPEADGQGGAIISLMRYYDRDEIQNALSDKPEMADLYTRYWRGRYITPTDYIFSGFQFQRPGDPGADWADGSGFSYRNRQQSYYDLGLNMTSQIGSHYVVAGGHYQKWTVRDYAWRGTSLASRIANDPSFVNLIQQASPDVAEEMRRTAVRNFGFDEFFNKIDEGPDGPKRPVTAALFINDKIEFSDIIINAGLRYDYFDMDLWTVEDPENPPFNEADFTVDDLQKAGGTGRLQPRLGLSFPVTNRTAFHLQYGKFAQMPDMFYTYASRAYMAVTLNGQNFIRSPFAWDLDPIVSTQYEIGLGHQFTDFAAFDITAFYRKTQGQLEIQRVDVVPTSLASDYNLFTNGDFAIARGVELTLRTRRVGNFMGMVNYTLTDAKGTNSEPSGQVASLEQGTAPPSLIQPLAFEERHRGAIVLDYRSDAPGNVLANDWVVNLLFTFHSGHRFTRSTSFGIGQRAAYEGALLSDLDPRNRIPLEPLNASVTPWFFNTDLRIEKGFDFGPAAAVVYGYVENLFNRKNVVNVFLRSGSAENDGFLNNPELSERIIAGQGPQYVDFYRNINVQNRQHYVADQGVDLFAPPRQIRLGVRVDF